MPSDPPIVDVKVRNPVTYIKLWWKRVMENEGVDFRFHIRPITAVLIALTIWFVGFGIGKVSFENLAYIPFLKYESNKEQQIPTPSSDSWRETALTGKLNQTPNTNKYYLVTTSTEAVALEFKQDIDLSKYIGRRILVSGSYNKANHILKVADILDLEVLPLKPVTVATPSPTVSPILIPAITPTIEPTLSPSPFPTDSS